MPGRVRRATALEPAAIQVILPDWWPLTDAEAIDFLHQAADIAAGIPLILYNPPHAVRSVPGRVLHAAGCRGGSECRWQSRTPC